MRLLVELREVFWRAFSLMSFVLKSRLGFTYPKDGRFLSVLREVGKEAMDKSIEDIRKELMQDHKQMEVLDLGAGLRGEINRARIQEWRTVSQIVRRSACPPLQSVLLRAIVRYYELRNVLELGTSLGIGTLSLAMGSDTVSVTTVEGAPAIQDIARSNVEKCGLEGNVTFRIGGFEGVLLDVLEGMKSLDLLYLDGHHLLEPTLKYYEMAKPYFSDFAIVVVDDIRWSSGMYSAWKILIEKEDILQVYDLYHCGIMVLDRSRDNLAPSSVIHLWPHPLLRWMTRS